MLNVFAGLLSLFLNHSPKADVLQLTNWSTLLSSTLVQSFIPARPDPVADAIVQQHIQAVKAMGMADQGQGVWVQTGSQTLADHLGETPLSAASLTKIATSLVALTTWGPNHQFDTVVSTTGTVQAGVLQGDLIVEGGGDPFFVWEEAIALGNALNQAGIRQVTGKLLIAGDFAMNYEADPATAGSLFKQGLDSSLWSDEVEQSYQGLPKGTARPQVAIAGDVEVVPAAAANAVTLVRHRSLPLVSILKSMNIYSNNSMAEMLATSLGGAATVAQKAALLAQVPLAEIQMVNGSGLGVDNRISPRAIVAMLIAMQRYLQLRQLSVADVFPVIGRDGGTPVGRHTPAATVVKTGTLDEVSSFAGVMPTRDRGLVWFSIINMGTADLTSLHDQQDLLLQRLQTAWGAANPLPPSILPIDSNSPQSWLGSADRNQVLPKG